MVNKERQQKWDEIAVLFEKGFRGSPRTAVSGVYTLVALLKEEIDEINEWIRSTTEHLSKR